MNQKKEKRRTERFAFLLFFFLLLIPFTVYFLRPDFVGFDTYGFLLLTCNGNNAAGIEGVPFYLFSILPCNLLALKVILFGLAFAAGCAIIKLSMLFSEKNGWRASYLIFLSPLLVLEFLHLENDQFAFPLLFVSLYLFFKGLKNADRFASLDCFGLLVIAAFFWQGAIFYLIGYTLNVWAIGIVSIPIIFWFRKTILGVIIRTWQVHEDLPFRFHYIYALFPGVAGVFLNPLLLPQALFFLTLGTISAKFWILSLPFLVVGMVLILEKAENSSKVGQYDLQKVFIVITVFCIIGISQSVWLNPPTINHVQAIEYAIEEEGKEIGIDWGLGYLAIFHGADTNSYGSFLNQQEFAPGQASVTEHDTNCAVLREFAEVKVVKC